MCNVNFITGNVSSEVKAHIFNTFIAKKYTVDLFNVHITPIGTRLKVEVTTTDGHKDFYNYKNRGGEWHESYDEPMNDR